MIMSMAARSTAIRIAALVLGICGQAGAQTLERRIGQISDRLTLSRPVSLSLAPSGAVFAVADQFTDHIFVLDTRGVLLWEVGEANRINQPAAVCLTADDELLFTEKNRAVVLRVSSKNPQLIDSVADLSASAIEVKSIDRLVRTPKGGFVILDRSKSQVLSVGADWKVRKVLAGHGQGKGRIWSPTDCAIDASGNIIVSDSRNFPMQVITAEGSVLFSAGWSSPVTQRGWDASALGIDLQNVYWVSDYVESRWRLYDRAGNEIEKRPFDKSMTYPVGVAFTADGRMIVIEDRGAILIFEIG